MTDKWSGTRKRAADLMLDTRTNLDLHQFVAERLAVNHPTLYVRYVDQYRMKKLADKQRATK